MGWSSGSHLMYEIIQSLKKEVKDDKVRQAIYEDIIPAFEDFDCDTLYECIEMDKAYALAYWLNNPDTSEGY